MPVWSGITRIPASFHDPEPEEQIRDGMGQYVGRKAPRSISDAVIKYAGQQRGRPIRIRLS